MTWFRWSLVCIPEAFHSVFAALTKSRKAGLINADCALRLMIDGAEPSRLKGKPQDAPRPEPTTICGRAASLCLLPRGAKTVLAADNSRLPPGRILGMSVTPGGFGAFSAPAP